MTRVMSLCHQGTTTNKCVMALHLHLFSGMPCCATRRVLCATVSRYAAPCRAVLCCAVPCRAVPCRPLLCLLMSCCAVLCCAVLCLAVLCYAVLGCTVLCRAALCCAVLCCAVLCCAVLCCAVLHNHEFLLTYTGALQCTTDVAKKMQLGLDRVRSRLVSLHLQHMHTSLFPKGFKSPT